MDVAICLVSIAVLLVSFWLWRRREWFKLFQRMGVPGPAPSFLWGNLDEMNQKGIAACIEKWAEQYGDIFGIFFGLQPYLCVTDVELLKLIQIKDFSKFNEKDNFRSGFGTSDERINKYMEMLTGQEWKNARSKLSPAFSTRKLNLMAPLVAASVDELLKGLEAGAGEGGIVDLGGKISLAVAEISLKLFTGLQDSLQSKPDSELVRALQEALKDSFSNKFVLLGMSFSGMGKVLEKVGALIGGGNNSMRTLFDIGEQVYRARLKMTEAPQMDVLQLLIDHKREAAASNSEDSKKMTLSDTEIIVNVFGFVLAGYDTVTAILTFAVYRLIKNPEIQDRLREEVREKLGNKTVLTLEDVNQLKYMDQVLSEVMRFYPFSATALQAVALEDYQLGNVAVPRGMSILIPMSVLHRSRNYWTHPELFDPDRFSPERAAEIPEMAFQPFGAGPRVCIGLRVAQLTVKSVLSRLLARFRLLPAPQTNLESLETEDSIFIIRMKKPVMACLEAV